MPEHVDAFESMMRELVREEGARLLEGEKAWRGLVPDSIDKAVYAAISAGTAAKAAPAAAGAAAKHIFAKAAAAVVAASVVVTGGACVVSPAFRARVSDFVEERFAGRSAYVESAADRTPGSYAIPSPGDGFTVTDEAANDRVQYKWFTSDEHDVLVEVAYQLPGGEADGDELLVLPGGFWGSYSEAGNQQIAVLHSGDIAVRITFSGAEKDDVVSYAELFASMN